MTTLDKLDRSATADEVYAAIDRDGFAILERYIDEAEVKRKKDDLIRVLKSTPTGRSDFEGFKTQRIYALFAKTRTFDDAAIDPLILDVAERVLGAGFQFFAPVGISIGPGETAQNLHPDDAVYPIPRPHRQVVMNVMWALDDFTEANGATVVVPGSHAWGNGEHPAPDTPTVKAVMPAGSVMIFVGSLFHGGGTNTTDASRLGVILPYCASWVRQLENQSLAVPREIVKQLPKRLQELLGYSVTGLLGYVDGVHPAKFLDDARRVDGGVVVP